MTLVGGLLLAGIVEEAEGVVVEEEGEREEEDEAAAGLRVCDEACLGVWLGEGPRPEPGPAGWKQGAGLWGLL